MNGISEKWAVDAAKYFKEEVLEIMPQIPREELARMVGEYVFYQQADVHQGDVNRVIQEAF